MRKHLNDFHVGVAPAAVDSKLRWGNKERQQFTAAVQRIAPHIQPVGRMERAKVAWQKYIGGHLSLRSMILVSRDYAAEFAQFRKQKAALVKAAPKPVKSAFNREISAAKAFVSSQLQPA